MCICLCSELKFSYTFNDIMIFHCAQDSGPDLTSDICSIVSELQLLNEQQLQEEEKKTVDDLNSEGKCCVSFSFICLSDQQNPYPARLFWIKKRGIVSEESCTRGTERSEDHFIRPQELAAGGDSLTQRVQRSSQQTLQNVRRSTVTSEGASYFGGAEAHFTWSNEIIAVQETRLREL